MNKPLLEVSSLTKRFRLEASGEEFSETDWCVMVEKVTVFKEKMMFLLTSGAEVEV